MNELILFIHSILILVFLLGALRLGKEALMCFIVLQTIIANMFVVKQAMIFQRHVTCADVYIIGSIIGMNLLQEYFGKESSKKTLWITFYCMAFFAIAAQFHLWYSPSIFDTTQKSFEQILSSGPRIVIASLVTFFIVQRWDIFGFAWMQKICKDRFLPIRILVSLLLSQLLDTVLFSFLGLYGIVERMFDIIFVSFSIKILIICFLTPFTHFSKRFVRT